MNKLKKIIISIIVFLILLSGTYQVLATNSLDGEIVLSERYLEYLALSEKQKENTIVPTMYEVEKSTIKITNPLKIARMLYSSQDEEFSLATFIPQNLVVKNQADLNLCWAFGSLATLESHLGWKDYKTGKTPIAYDFSERHMDYATSRVFADGEINEWGFNRTPGSMGTFQLPMAYLTNGLGAVAEQEMQFQDTAELIDIDEIKNKNVITQVNDVIIFPSISSTDDLTQIKNQIKEHIINNGAVQAAVNAFAEETYNSETGAAYVSDGQAYKSNHSVAIVGWDDTYDKENFLEGNQPTNNGAWIAKNSHGTEFGNQGFVYISYEDANIYQELIGVQDAQNEVTYENIYQYDEMGGYLGLRLGVPKIYLATEFDKKSIGKDEYLTQVSIRSNETYTCKVYVNPNGTSKSSDDLQPVELKLGDSETFDAGYHTLEFLNPIKITGDSFVVALEIVGGQTDKTTVLVEANYSHYYPNGTTSTNRLFSNVTVADSKCFLTTQDGFDANEWIDTSEYTLSSGKPLSFDTTIKAFTTSKVLESISAETNLVKTSYVEGQNFDKTGLVVKANYTNGESHEVTDYKILNGEDLEAEQTSVTIVYEGKTVEIPIVVAQNIIPDEEPTVPEVSKTVTGISVKTKPTKTEYMQNKEKLDLTGGVIEILYNDNTTEELSMKSDGITTEGFNNKQLGKQNIVVKYQEFIASFEVTIKELPKPENSKMDTVQANLTGMKAYYFTDDSKKEYVTISVKLTDFIKATVNDSMEYYYYLSSSPNEKNITDWVEIEVIQDTAESLGVEINTLDIENYEELVNANKIYLYVKEIATRNDITAEKITSPLDLNIENVNIEEFIDGEKKADVKPEEIIGSVTGEAPDNTTAQGEIPKAGKNILTIFFGLSIVGIVIIYRKYKDIEIK